MPTLFCETCERMAKGRLDQRACPTCGTMRYLHNRSFTGERSMAMLLKTPEARNGRWVPQASR